MTPPPLPEPRIDPAAARRLGISFDALDEAIRQVRARVRAFEQGSRAHGLHDPGTAYACLKEQQLLLALYDDAVRHGAHVMRAPPTDRVPASGLTPAPLPALAPQEATELRTTPATAMLASLPSDGWNAALAAARLRAVAAVGRVIASRGSLHDAQREVAGAIDALTRAPPSTAAGAPVVPPPAEPPFTVGP